MLSFGLAALGRQPGRFRVRIPAMLHRLRRIPLAIACAALFLLMVMTFCDVVLRSTMNAPIAAAPELTRILMAIIVFSVMPIISSRNGHIAVDLADGLFLRLGLVRERNAAIHMICGVALIWPLQRVWLLAERARSYGDVTEYLGIPQFYIGWFIAGSLASTAMAMVATGILIWFKPGFLDERA